MLLVTPEKIASIMSIIPVPHTFAELDKLVSLGLPKHALKAIVDNVGKNSEERKQLLYRIIPEATYKRRRDKLSAEESERTERLARIYATAQYVWNTDNDARQFLHTPHPLLQDQAPLDVSLTELGARRVEELLWQLYYGIAA
ncbi:antitoxin Xre/MbcA/ParS toxin-binding domain-containing protein [Methyloglobulus sp.]|uniref:antitoxin Xre/MbcA/ParS toxin-binding domain-containing protein n=1 Tax=Methyloglobulus sp. TaxID=2518622 RepID=UPI0032B81107